MLKKAAQFWVGLFGFLYVWSVGWSVWSVGWRAVQGWLDYVKRF